MALARWQATIVDEAGNILNGASVTVRREVAGAPLASLFSDRDGLVAIGNPITVGADGFAAFHAVGGAYRIDATKDSFSRTWRYVAMGLQGESDAILLDISYLFDEGVSESDPEDGQFRFNDADLSLVTKVFISNIDDVGANLETWLDRIDDYGSSSDRGILIIRSLDGAAEFIGQVTGSVVDEGPYRDITVTHLASAGAFVASGRVGINFIPRGVDGSITASGTLVQDKLVLSESSSQIKNTTTNFTGDLDTIASTVSNISMLRVGTGATNGPSGATVNGSHVITHVWDTNSARQIYLEQNSNRIWTRSKASGSWGAWGTVGAGRQTIAVPAGAMKSRVTSGAGVTDFDSGSNDVTISTLAFDQTTGEFAQFMVPMPKGWDEGTVTFIPFWTATAGTGTVRWTLAGVAISNDDTLNAAMGTAQNSDDTLIATNDLHIGPESSAITIGGTPAEGDLVAFQIGRDVANDTLTADALLIAIKVLFTTTSNTDE